MTETQAEAPGTEVDPVITGALQYRLAHPNASIKDLAAQVVPVADPAPVPVAKPFPALPAQPDLTEQQLAALARLPQIFAKLRVKTRRWLKPSERETLMQEAETLEVIKSLVAARLEVIKELARTSMDVLAEKEGRAFPADTDERKATPRDQFGHYLLAAPQNPERLVAGELAWSQEYSQGAALPAGPQLLKLLQDGEITAREFLGFTRATRVLDEAKAAAFIDRNPARGLEILRKITVRTEPSSRLNVRKAK